VHVSSLSNLGSTYSFDPGVPMQFYGLCVTGVQSWIACWSDAVFRSCEAFVHGDAPLPSPVELDIVGGERLPDLLQAGMLTGLSPRMSRALRNIGATGYSLAPLVLRHPTLGVAINGYEALVVHGRGGPLDESRMQPIKRTGDAILSCRGFHIYEERWDGSDVFCIDGLGVSIWVTERVAEVLRKVRPKLRNVELVPNTQPWPHVPEAARQHATKPMWLMTSEDASGS